MANDDMQLVQDYVQRHSDSAFETLVSRHINLVYSAALRRVSDTHLADEIVQAVFILFARKAPTLGADTIVPAWLYRTTCFVAADTLRTHRRRQQREHAAHTMMPSDPPESPSELPWEHLAPVLDDALMKLGESDRRAVVLHFFEKKNFAEIGSFLGMSPDTARKRTSRALEKLRRYLAQGGIASSTAALAATISVNAVHAAPATLAKTVATTALSHAAAPSTLTLIKGALKLMAWTKTKTTVVCLIALALATTAIVVEHKSGDHPEAPVLLTKESLANAGQQTPAATLQTLMWALSSGNTNAFLACCSPEEQARHQQQWANKSQEALTAEAKAQFDSITGIKILSQTPLTDDQVLLVVSLEGMGKTEKMKFQKVDNDWKYTRVN